MITVIGESLVDIIDVPAGAGAARGFAAWQAHPGGSPLNVAVGCARLGLRAKLVTHFGDDAHDQLIADHLSTNKVEAIVGGSLPTSSALVSLDRTARSGPPARDGELRPQLPARDQRGRGSGTP